MADGSLQPIESVRAEASVWAYDRESNDWCLGKVVAALEHEYDGVVVTVGVGNAEIEATANHPFWVVSGVGLADRPAPRDVYAYERGMTDGGCWVEADDLEIGDALLLRDGGTLLVESLSTRHAKVTVYNLQVERLRTYAVGESGVLVHNKPMRNIPNRPSSPRKPTDHEIRTKLGEHPHDLKDYGSKSNIYVDKDTGWLYEGSQDGQSWRSLDFRHPDWE